MCIYVYTHVHEHAHTHTYIHMYTHVCIFFLFSLGQLAWILELEYPICMPTWLLAFGFWLLAPLGFTWLVALGLVSLGFVFGCSLHLALGVCWVLVL